MENISKHVTYHEAVISKTAIDHKIANKPDDKQLAAMQHVATYVFDNIRDHFNVPIGITSFFRSAELNKAVGGSATSQHCKGEAIDIDAKVYGKITNADIFNYIKNNLDFDQLIWEFGNDEQPSWVHVSLKAGVNNKEILKAVKSAGKTIYKKY